MGFRPCKGTKAHEYGLSLYHPLLHTNICLSDNGEYRQRLIRGSVSGCDSGVIFRPDFIIPDSHQTPALCDLPCGLTVSVIIFSELNHQIL